MRNLKKRTEWTKWHETAVLVVLPALVTWVVELIFHPPMWVLFLIGLVPVVAILDLIGLLRPLTAWRAIIICVTLVSYIWVEQWTSNRYAALESQKRSTEIWNNLIASVSLPSQGSVMLSSFTFKNQGSYDVYVAFLGCRFNVVWADGRKRFGYVPSFGPGSEVLPSQNQDEVIVRPERNRLLRAGTDGLSDQCLRFPNPPSDPTSSIVCADVTVNLIYSLLASDVPEYIKVSRSPDFKFQVQTNAGSHIESPKSSRFTFYDGSWRQERLDEAIDYCGRFPMPQ